MELSGVNHPAPATTSTDLLRSESAGGGRSLPPLAGRAVRPEQQPADRPPPEPVCTRTGRATLVMQVSTSGWPQRHPSLESGLSPAADRPFDLIDWRRPALRRSLAEISPKER